MAELGSLRALGPKGRARCLMLSMKFHWNTVMTVYVLLSVTAFVLQ